MIFRGVEELIGNTPIVRLKRLFNQERIDVLGKLEFFNPTFSVKDRAAYFMVKKALDNKKIKQGDTLIEATSGNTGLGLCVASKVYNLRLICVLFDDVSIEKITLLKSYGAEIVICDSTKNSNEKGGYVWTASKLKDSIPNAFLVSQFDNKDNVEAHYTITGPEIWEQVNGNINYFFSTIGTGGTISGVGKYLKEKNKAIKVIGVEPIGGIYRDVYNGKSPVYKDHLIHSISDNFLSPNMDFNVIDDIIQVEDIRAFSMCHNLIYKEGICAGTSSGCVLEGVDKYFKENKNLSHDADLNVLAILPDIGLKYIDTLFNNDYLKEHKIEIKTSKDEFHRDLIDKSLETLGIKYKIV